MNLAQKMRERTDLVLGNKATIKTKEIYPKIIDKISELSSIGKSSLSINYDSTQFREILSDGLLRKKIEDKLKDDGFKTTYVTSYSEYYQISW